MKELNKSMKKLLDKAESLDWNYTRENEPELAYGGWACSERNYIVLEKYSPKGEDFIALIDFDADNQVETFMVDLMEYAEDFDIDEHIEMWIPMRGKGGCPESISDLAEDAKAIKEMLMELYNELEKLAS